MAKQYQLKEDVYSGKKQLYGKRFDIVKEVAVHDTVLIVEKKNGERFPIHITKLKEIIPNQQ